MFPVSFFFNFLCDCDMQYSCNHSIVVVVTPNMASFCLLCWCNLQYIWSICFNMRASALTHRSPEAGVNFHFVFQEWFQEGTPRREVGQCECPVVTGRCCRLICLLLISKLCLRDVSLTLREPTREDQTQTRLIAQSGRSR